MKINSTLSLFVFGSPFNTPGNSRTPYHYIPYLTFFLFTSLLSFAGVSKTSTEPVPGNHNYLNNFMPFFSPLTGPESIRTNLYLLNANNTLILADGVLTEYNNLYHDIVTMEDAYKFTNIRENLGLARYGTVLAVERRPIISTLDTLFFKLWKTTRRSYQLEFVTANLNHPGMQAFLEDAYLGTHTLITLNGTTKINFSINTDAASAHADRFRIIYHTNLSPGTLPVTFASVKGYQSGNKISIDWKVENEINIDKYEIERSASGKDFGLVSLINATGQNRTYSTYSWVDDNAVMGNNFYRIKSVDRDGSKKVSTIIKVTTGKIGNGSITIYPNPIQGNILNLQFTNQPIGVYQVRLVGNNGQVVYSGRLALSSANTSQAIVTNKKLAAGIYQMEIKAPGNIITTQKAIVRD